MQVKSIAEMGAYVALLEYNGIEGMILLSELSRRRIRSITKLIKVRASALCTSVQQQCEPEGNFTCAVLFCTRLHYCIFPRLPGCSVHLAASPHID